VKVEKDLRERTKQFTLRIIRLYRALPKRAEARVIGRQVLRSGTSIGAHYREASRGRSNAEFVSKIGVALQELDETAYWLELLVEAEIVSAKKLEALHGETDELIAIFTAIIKKVKNKDEDRKVKDKGLDWVIDKVDGIEELDKEESGNDDLEDNGAGHVSSETNTDYSGSQADINPAYSADLKKNPATNTPPPPPTWAEDDQAIIETYSYEPNSTLSDSSFSPHPSTFKPPSPPLSFVEYQGERYRWDGKGWCDSNYVTTPQVVVQQLNGLLTKQLAVEDREITDCYELLRRARYARENQQHDRASRLARQVIRLDPGNCGAAAVLCATLRARGRSREALSETITFVKAANSALLTSRAAAYCDLDMWEQAKKEVGRSLTMEKSDMAFAVVDRIKAARPELYK
jgi:four helix bundle protein